MARSRRSIARLLKDVAFVVVVLSLLVQGWTLAPLARLLRPTPV